MRSKPNKKGWEQVSGWYDGIVGKTGHYYHEQIILPRVTDWLREHYGKGGALLDLACGQGVLERALPKGWEYLGLDIAPSLIEAAKKASRDPKHQFLQADVTGKLPCEPDAYDIATVILALQDIQDFDLAFINASKHLKRGGQLLAVVNHPCFRMPRQSSWGIDEEQQIQYRRIDRYLSPMSIPIQMEPSKGEASKTVHSYHRPMQDYVNALADAGLAVVGLEEWTSDKVSTGSKARMENRAREEIPLFLFLVATKFV